MVDARTSLTRLAFILCLLLCLCLPAVPARASEDRGLFFGASRGAADFDQTVGRRFDQILDGDEDVTSFEAGWRFSRFWGLAAGYHDFETVRSRAQVACLLALGIPCLEFLEGDTEAYSLALFAELPLPLGFSVFGKVGGAASQTDVRAIFDVGADEIFDDRSEEHLLYGVGVRFRVIGGLSVLGQWETFGDELEVVSLGLRLQF